ncbi:MAG: Rrf2 family transcriptional regulator [Cyanobacteriota bacterium]|nr:Rrf2 family transcriptional regulator [Cyanobacteriota bacterium]
MIGRTGVQALKALLELAQEPDRWRSVSELAAVQGLPAPHLEQLMLRLRRAGVLEARRGRQGGYRLAGRPEDLSLNRVLLAVGAWPGAAEVLERPESGPRRAAFADPATPPTPAALESPGIAQSQEAPLAVAAPAEGAGADPAMERVAVLLRQRLRRAIDRELERLTLAELLFDLRSARAGLSEEGGLMLG